MEDSLDWAPEDGNLRSEQAGRLRRWATSRSVDDPSLKPGHWPALRCCRARLLGFLIWIVQRPKHKHSENPKPRSWVIALGAGIRDDGEDEGPLKAAGRAG